ncbi:MAG: histidine phosphatase family protein [Alphaproteobacteria bacterium]|jgi:probable phosphoglycerate mutase|nr:histidine phosphatase family protein [Alphaproteobacteria bacterium]MDP6566602.1 histidine phosphatase family protein [Alphaproteobacteria bacterium]MDP6811977.1 histidine phosphatase family protein [Alphaproteobacteria bacterium]
MSDALPGTSGRRRVYLMRHGEVRYFDQQGKVVHPKFVELTEDGREQATTMGRLLAEVPFDRAICSGLPRTLQTAGLVLDGRQMDLEERPALREIKSGNTGGKSREWNEAQFIYGMEGAAEPGARFAGGDVYREFYDRVRGEFLRLLGEPGWRNMLVVAHEGTNRMILGWASYGGLAAVRSYEQDPGCLNIIDADLADGEIIRRFIKLMNLTPDNHSKYGNNLTSMEQVFDYRRRVLTGEGKG